MLDQRSTLFVLLNAWLAGGLILSASVASSGERDTTIISDPIYLHPQRLVSIEANRRLNLYCTGKGSPTVIFDSGLGGLGMDWAKVQPVIARRTRACSYDRAGLGFSDPSPRDGTSAHIVDDLHRLLRAAGIRPPYVLVGHSMGGMNIKLYTATYPNEVEGLVFVDPSYEDLSKRSWALQPENAKIHDQVAKYNDSLRECLVAKPEEFTLGSKLQLRCAVPPNTDRFSEAIDDVLREKAVAPGHIRGWSSEQLNIWTVSADQLRAARKDFGDLPLVVLTHEPLPRSGNETRELRDALNAVRTELHEDIARMSTRGAVRMVRNSGHYQQLDQPGDVSAAILDVVNTAKSRSGK